MRRRFVSQQEAGCFVTENKSRKEVLTEAGFDLSLPYDEEIYVFDHGIQGVLFTQEESAEVA